MNRFVVAMVAFGLSAFAVGCVEQRVDVFEQGASPGDSDDALQPGQYPKGMHVVTPVETNKDSADTALNPSVALTTPGLNVANPGQILPSSVLGPVVDPAYDSHMGVDGTLLPATNIDPWKVEQEPGLGLIPTEVIALPPTEGEGMAEKSKF